jgi:hypothetical protein
MSNKEMDDGYVNVFPYDMILVWLTKGNYFACIFVITFQGHTQIANQ